MNENSSGTGNLLDTTDCLEAVGVFRGWKNLFFIIILFCILILQTCFWLSDLGMIEMPKEVGLELGSIQFFYAEPQTDLIPDGNEVGIISDSNEAAQPKETPDPNQAAKESSLIKLAAVANASSPNDINEMSDNEKDKAGFFFGITFNHIVWLMRFVNAVLMLAAILYCFTMLFSLKLSMLGRLGGINHITRAFFLALLLLVFILPWQRVFGSIITGAIFTPEEFVKWHAEKTGDIIDKVLYYMRFCGYMVFVFLILILAQIRSGRWAKAILRRLEII